MRYTKFVVDAHVFIWFVGGDNRLSATARALLNDEANRFLLPAIAFAEACWIVSRRPLGVTIKDLTDAIDSDARFSVYSLDRAIIEKSNALQAVGEMHDRQIAATAALLIEAGENVALITHDADITASGVVPVVW